MLSRLICRGNLLKATLLKNSMQNATIKPNFQLNQTRRFKFQVKPPSVKVLTNIGLGLVGIGLGALYSHTVGSDTKYAYLWPDYVKTRMRDTFMYLAVGFGITAISASVFHQLPMNLVPCNSLKSYVPCVIAFYLWYTCGALAIHNPNSPDSNSKQLFWAANHIFQGALIAMTPLGLAGGPILMRAAQITTGVIGGLTLSLAASLNNKFLAVPCAIAYGVVLASSSAGVYLLSLYGGFVMIFGLYRTEEIIEKAEKYEGFDPIDSEIGIFLDIMKMFNPIHLINLFNKLWFPDPAPTKNPKAVKD